MATNSREARRRKIMERGSDRLALITGRLQNLPSSPPSQPPDLHSQSHLPYSTNVSSHGEDKISSSVLLEDNHSTDASPTKDDFGGSTLEPRLSALEINPESIQSPVSEGGEPRPSLFSTTNRSTSVSNLATERHAEPQAQKHKFFSSSEISSALAATETTRLFCSVAVALLVIFSYLGTPIPGSKIINSILSFGPLFLVFLTNATVFLAQLLGKRRSLETADRRDNNAPPASENDWTEQLGKTLETGLLIQRVADALFVDCAVYAVIVVSGLSFAQKLH